MAEAEFLVDEAKRTGTVTGTSTTIKAQCGNGAGFISLAGQNDYIQQIHNSTAKELYNLEATGSNPASGTGISASVKRISANSTSIPRNM